MSVEIDQHIVDVEFRHDDFEKGVNGVLGSLQKLKEGLQFGALADGASKLSSAIGNISFDSFGNSIGDVTNRISAWEAVAIGAAMRVGQKLADAGERLVKSMSIDQVSEGWNKFQSKTESVATIMSATGLTVDQVNEQLDRLLWFTDETSYNFSDMTSNIAKFTSQGIDLSDATIEMEGIAAWAALAGQGANEASRAMYNLSQALGAGAVKLIDWKSIQNANMATKEYKELVLEIAAAQGELQKSAKGTFYYLDSKGKEVEVNAANFANELSQGFFTSSVLEESLLQYGKFADLLQTVTVVSGKSATELLKDIKLYENGALDIGDWAKDTGVELAEAQKAFEAFTSAEYDLGRRAFIAGQEARTFTQAIEATKDAASTTFMRMFEDIFGNYEEAKDLWTSLVEVMYNVLVEPLNKIEEVLGKWNELGGRDNMLTAFTQLGTLINSFIDPVKTAWEEVFPSDVETRAEKGVVAFQKLANAFQKLTLSGESAEKLKSFFTGLFDVFKDVKGLFDGFATGAKLVGYGLLDIGKALGGQLFDGLGKIGEEIQNGSGIFSKASQYLIEFGFNIRKTLGDVATSISESDILGRFIGIVSDGLGTVVSGAKKLAGPLKTAVSLIGDIAAKLLTVIISVVDEKALDSIALGITAITKLVGAVVSIIETLGKAFKSSFVSIGDSSVTILESLINGVLKVVDTFASWIIALSDFIQTNETFNSILTGVGKVFGKIVEGIVNFVKALTSSDTALSVYSTIWNVLRGIYEVLVSIGKVGIGAISAVVNAVKSLFASIRDMPSVQTAFSSISEAASDLFQWISSGFGSLSDSVGNFVDSIRDSGFAKAFEKSFAAIDDVSEGFEERLSEIKTEFSDTGDSAETMSDKIKKSLSNVYDTVRSGSSKAITSLAKFIASLKESKSVPEMWAKIKDALKSVFNYILDFVPKAIKSIRNFIEEAKDSGKMTTVFSWITAEAKAFWDFLKDLGSKVGTIVDELCQTFDSILGLPFFTNFASLLGGIKDNLVGLFTGVDPETSLPETLDSITGSFQAFDSAVTPVVDRVSGAMDTTGDSISNFGTLLGNFVDKTQSVIDVLKGIADEYSLDKIINMIFAGATVAAVTKASNSEEKVFTSVSKGITSFFKGLGTVLTAVPKAIDGFAKLEESVAAIPSKIAGTIGVFKDKVLPKLTRAFSKDIKAHAFKTSAAGVLELAEGILVLAAALWIISKVVEGGNLEKSIAALVVLSGILAGLSIAVAKLSETNFDFGKGKGGTFTRKGGGLAILEVALGLLVVAMAINKLVKVTEENPPGKVVGAVLILAVIVKSLYELIGVMCKLPEGVNMTKVGAGMLIAAFALGKMEKVLSKLVELAAESQTGDLIKACGMLGGIMWAVGKLMSKTAAACAFVSNPLKLGGALIEIALALGILEIVLAACVRLVKNNGLLATGEGFVVLGALGFGLWEFMQQLTWYFGGSSSVDYAAVGKSLLGVAGAMWILAQTLKICIAVCTEEDFGKIIGGLILLAGVAAAVVGLMWALSKIDQAGGSVRGGAGMIFVAAAMLILALIVKILSTIAWDDLWPALVGISVMGGIMVALLAVSKNASAIYTQLLGIVIAAGVMVAAIAILASVPDQSAVKNAANAFAEVVAAMAVLLFASKFATGKSVGQIALLALVVAGIAGIFWHTQSMPTDGLLEKAEAMSMILGAMAVSMAIMGSLTKKSGGELAGIVGTSLLLLVALYGIADVFQTMEGITTDGLFEKAASISLVLGAMALSMGIASLLTGNSSGIDLVAIAVAMDLLVVAVRLIGETFLVLKDVPSDGMFEKAESISLVLGVMATILALLAGLHVSAEAGLSATVALAEFIGGLAAVFAAFVGIFGFLESVGLDLDKFMELMDRVIEFFQKIGQAIGELIGGVIGGVIGGFEEAISETLVPLATNLSTFAERLGPFVTTMRVMSSGGLMKTVGDLVDFIDKLAATSFLDAVSRLIGGGESMFSSLGDSISELAGGLVKFTVASAGMTLVDGTAIENAMAAAERFVTMYNEMPEVSKIKSWFTGDKSGGLEGFSTFISNLSTYLPDIIEAAGTFDVTAGMKVADLVSVLTTLTSITLPTQTGLTGNFEGFAKDLKKFVDEFEKFLAKVTTLEGLEEDSPVVSKVDTMFDILGKFTSLELPDAKILERDDLKAYGKSISNFAESFKEFCEKMQQVDTSMVYTKTAIMRLVLDALGQVSAPNAGTLSGWLESLGTKSMLANLGKGFKEYCEALPSNMSSAENAKDYTQYLADTLAVLGPALESSTPDMGFLSMGMSYDSFFGLLGTIATSFAAYSAAIADVDTNVVSNTETITATLKALSEGLDGITFGDAFLEGGLGVAFNSLGQGLTTYYTAMTAIDDTKLEDITKRADTLISTLSKFANGGGAGADVASAFADSMKNIGTKGMEALYNSLGESKDKLVENVKNLTQAVVEAINGSVEFVKTAVNTVITTVTDVLSGDATISSITSAAKEIADTILNHITPTYESVHSVGKFIDDGMKAGMKDNADSLYQTAYDISKNVVQSMKKGANEQSPSKDTRLIGRYLDLGMVKGIEDYRNKVYGTAEGLSKGAVSAMSDAMSKANDAFESTSGAPTIRPVVDLSDAISGANAINSLFGSRSMNLAVSNATLSAGTMTASGRVSLLADSVDALEKRLAISVENQNRSDMLYGNLVSAIDKMTTMGVYINGKTLVGEIAPDMSTSLGGLAVRRNRGMA